MAAGQIDWKGLKLKTERTLLWDHCIREVVGGPKPSTGVEVEKERKGWHLRLKR